MRNDYLQEQDTITYRKRPSQSSRDKHSRHSHASSRYDHASRRMRMRKHKRSHFIRNFAIFTIAMIIIILLTFMRLWNYLADYQDNLPSMLGDKILNAYESADTTIIKTYCNDLPSSLQDDLIFHKYLNKLLTNQELYYYESDTSNDSIVYTYRLGEETFAKLTLEQTSEKSKYGFVKYKIASLEQYSLQDITLEEGVGTTIYIGESSIDSSYLTTSTSLGTIFEQINAGPFTSNTYVLPDYLLTDEVTAVDTAGNSCTLEWNQAHTKATSNCVLSASTEDAISTFATKAAKEYAVFASIKYASRDALLTYLYPGTDFYQAIKTYDNDWGITKTSDSFDHVTVHDYIQYSSTEYSCVVDLDYIVKQGNTEKTYPLSFICYITSIDGTYKIVNLESNTVTKEK